MIDFVETIEHTGRVITRSDWCPGIWDGWMCWPDTPPHSTQQHPCPSFIRFGTEDNCECK
jgi:hypothetical protein